MVMEELHEWTADSNKALSVTLGEPVVLLPAALCVQADMRYELDGSIDPS
jgi:hypothetical protein